METKMCVRCQEELPVNNFYAQPGSKDGFRHQCKSCYREVSGRDYNQPVAPAPEGYKRCSSCGKVKLLNEYHKQKSTRDGYRNQCKLCRSKNEGIGYKQPVPAGFRRCAKCSEVKPATHEYFAIEPRTADACSAQCRVCIRDNYNENKARYLQNRRLVYINIKDVINHARRDAYRTNPEKVLKRNRAWSIRNADRVRLNRQRYYQEHLLTLREQNKLYQRHNLEAARERRKTWYHRNLSYARQKARFYKIKRMTLLSNLPFKFTEKDWTLALEYFDYGCAICGCKPDKDRKLAMDHWIALSDNCPHNPGTVPHNIIPLCHGINGCNLSKGSRNAELWLIEKLGVEMAAHKLQEIQIYFEHVKSIKTP